MNKKIRKIDDQEEYEKSGLKSMMDDVEKTKKEALESVPQIPREQVSSGEETTKDDVVFPNIQQEMEYPRCSDIMTYLQTLISCYIFVKK